MKRWMVVTVVLAVVVVALGAATSSCSSPEASPRKDGGPIEPPNGHGWALSVKPGKVFTDGLEVIYVRGNESAVLDSVEIIADDELELVEAFVVPPPRVNAAVQLIMEWPPTDSSFGEQAVESATGAVIRPAVGEEKSGWELLLSMRATKAGQFQRTGVKILYHVGSDRYQVTFPAEMIVCVDPGVTNYRDCESES